MNFDLWQLVAPALVLLAWILGRIWERVNANRDGLKSLEAMLREELEGIRKDIRISWQHCPLIHEREHRKGEDRD